MKDLLVEIAEASRRTILAQLLSGAKNVSEIVENTGMKQPNVSNHLSKLRSRAIVRSNKVGRQVYYSLATAEIANALEALLQQAHFPEVEQLSFPDAALRYAKAAVLSDESTCSEIVDSLLRHKVDLLGLYQHVLAESMTIVGTWYEVQAITVAQEHMASAITERMMSKVVHYASPLSPNATTVMLGCVPGNFHSIGLRMLSDYMRLSGYKTIYLGASVPIEAFISAVEQHKPILVMVSVATRESTELTLELVTRLRVLSASMGFLIGVGGRPVNENTKPFLTAGAHFTAKSLIEFSENIMPRIKNVLSKPTTRNGARHDLITN
ncbi:MAG: metalloregulator ArsR/SmtB family transcription factor [Armatimonadetes bacterium]|nr:metalloregulator ArsR/SmtB family transcription factor [Armatimonadota bacterium]